MKNNEGFSLVFFLTEIDEVSSVANDTCFKSFTLKIHNNCNDQ